MKFSSLLFSFLIFSSVAFSQAQVGTVEFQKNQQPAAVLQLSYSPDIVSDAIADYMSKTGKPKGSDLKGFTSFRSGSKDSVNTDLYLKVERKSRKEKDISIISLLLSVPREALPAGTVPGYLSMEQAKTILNDMIPAIEARNLEAQIKDQTTALNKAETKYKNLKDDESDLERKKSALERKIQENKDDQQKQTTEIESQKAKLAELIAKRKK